MKNANKALKKLALRHGYDFTFRKLPTHTLRNRELKLERDLEPEFVDIFMQVRDYTLTTPECIYALWSGVRHLVEAGVEGDFVECGVYRGGSAMTIALTLQQMGITDRSIWLYDTYAGMTEPTEHDIRLRDGTEQLTRWQMQQRTDDDGNDWCFAPLPEVQANMARTNYPEELLHYIVGDVAETIPDQAPDKLALLRLDTDWYPSTLHELQQLYPRLSAGGVLIIDDYGAYAGSRKATDEYFAANGPKPFLNRIDTAARIAVKPA